MGEPSNMKFFREVFPPLQDFLFKPPCAGYRRINFYTWHGAKSIPGVKRRLIASINTLACGSVERLHFGGGRVTVKFEFLAWQLHFLTITNWVFFIRMPKRFKRSPPYYRIPNCLAQKAHASQYYPGHKTRMEKCRWKNESTFKCI